MSFGDRMNNCAPKTLPYWMYQSGGWWPPVFGPPWPWMNPSQNGLDISTLNALIAATSVCARPRRGSERSGTGHDFDLVLDFRVRHVLVEEELELLVDPSLVLLPRDAA